MKLHRCGIREMPHTRLVWIAVRSEDCLLHVQYPLRTRMLRMARSIGLAVGPANRELRAAAVLRLALRGSPVSGGPPPTVLSPCSPSPPAAIRIRADQEAEDERRLGGCSPSAKARNLAANSSEASK